MTIDQKMSAMIDSCHIKAKSAMDNGNSPLFYKYIGISMYLLGRRLKG